MATPDQEIGEIKAALAAGRRGGASVTRLALAHEMSEKYPMPNVTAQLRQLLRVQIPDPTNGNHIWIARNVVIGMATGVMTFMLMNVMNRQKKFSLNVG